MSSVPSSRKTAAVRHTDALYSAAQPAHNPAPHKPGMTRPPSTSGHTGKTMAIGIAAAIFALFGMAYIYCCACVAREGYRRATLQTTLQRERDNAQVLLQKHANLYTKTYIDQQARSIGMVPATDQNTFVLK